MKSSLLCSTISVLLLASFGFAAPVDDTHGTAISDNIEESNRNQLSQEFSENLQLDETASSPLLGLLQDVWTEKILSKLAISDAGKLLQAGSEFRAIIKARLGDFAPVVKACGNETGNVLIKQQWYSDYHEDAMFDIQNKTQAEIVHKCLKETKNWAETLDRPQTVKVKIELNNDNETADLLLDEELFGPYGKARFSLKVSVRGLFNRFTKVFRAVAENECILSLDLESQLVSEGHVVILAEILRDNTWLQELNLSLNNIGSRGANALAKVLETNTGLLSLNLAFTFIGDEEVIALAKALKNTNLQKLDLSNNRISDNGLKALLEALKSSRTLKELSLNSIAMSIEGMRTLAQEVANSTLLKLYIGGNHIGDDGAQLFAEALKSNRYLTEMQLWRNDIMSSGAKAIAKALKSNSVLQSLDLRMNEIEQEGAMAFSDVLKHDNALQELFISDSKLRNETIDELRLLAEKKVTRNGKPFLLQI